MTTAQKVGTIGAIFVLWAYVTLVSFIGDHRIRQPQDHVYELECRHVLFEDGSSLHKDAELVQACIASK